MDAVPFPLCRDMFSIDERYLFVPDKLAVHLWFCIATVFRF
jgi:hypothetical protein